MWDCEVKIVMVVMEIVGRSGVVCDGALPCSGGGEVCWVGGGGAVVRVVMLVWSVVHRGR